MSANEWDVVNELPTEAIDPWAVSGETTLDGAQSAAADPWQGDDWSEIKAQPKPESDALGRLGDVALDAAKGTVGLGQAFVGLGSMATGGLLGDGMRALGYDPERTNDFLSSLYSDARKHEEQRIADAKGFSGTANELLGQPLALAGKVVETAPMMLGTIATARMFAAKASASAYSAALAKGATEQAAKKIALTAAAKAGTVAAAASEGAMQAGSSFDELMAEGVNIGKAYVASIGSGATTAATSLIGGKIGKKLGLGDVEAGIAGRGGLTSRMVGGGVQEGLLEEMPQSATEQAWMNFAKDKPLTEGVAKAAGTGAIVGSMAGAGFSAFNKPTDNGDGNTAAYDGLPQWIKDEDGDLGFITGFDTKGLSAQPEQAPTLPPAEKAPGAFTVDAQGNARPTLQSEAVDRARAEAEAEKPYRIDYAPPESELELAPVDQAGPYDVVAESRYENGIDFSDLPDVPGNKSPESDLYRADGANAEANSEDFASNEKGQGLIDRTESTVTPPPVTEEAEQSAKVKLPSNFADRRLGRQDYRVHLEAMAKELVKGGGISLVPDAKYRPSESDKRGEVPMVRTSSLNPEWFQSMNEESDLKMSVEKTRAAVDRAMSGKRLGVREARVIGAMLDEVSGERNDPRNIAAARAQLQAVRENMRRIRKGMPPWDAYNDDHVGERFEEDAYEDTATAEARSLHELADEARQYDDSLAEYILERPISDAQAASMLLEAIRDGRARRQEEGARGREREGVRPAQDQGRPGERDQAEAPRSLTEEEITQGLEAFRENHRVSEANNAQRFEAMMAQLRAEGFTDAPANTGAAGDIQGSDKAAAATAATPQKADKFPKQAALKEKLKSKRPQAESFELAKQSPEDLKAVADKQAAAEKDKSDAEARVQADSERDSFVLAGSDSAVDQAEARGQGNLFGQKPEAKTLDEAAAEAALSPENDLAEPTDAQKEAGNYKVGKITLHGMPISIENPKGSNRSGTDPDGKKWSVEMKSHYGYVRGTEGKDGDHVDVFLTDSAEDASLPVFVIDQVDPKTRRLDEHKAIIGAKTEEEARQKYLENYDAGWQGIGGVKEFTLEGFKHWVKNGDTKSRVAEPDKQKALKKKTTGAQEPAEVKPEAVTFAEFEERKGGTVFVKGDPDALAAYIEPFAGKVLKGKNGITLSKAKARNRNSIPVTREKLPSGAMVDVFEDGGVMVTYNGYMSGIAENRSKLEYLYTEDFGPKKFREVFGKDAPEDGVNAYEEGQQKINDRKAENERREQKDRDQKAADKESEAEEKKRLESLSVKLEEDRARRWAETIGSGKVENDRYQAFLDTVEDPSKITSNAPYMAWISQRVAEFEKDNGRRPYVNSAVNAKDYDARLTAYVRQWADDNLSARIANPEKPAEPDTDAEVTKAKKALDDAGVTGVDRTSTIAAVRRGDLTADDVAESHKGEEAPAEAAQSYWKKHDNLIEGLRNGSVNLAEYRDGFNSLAENREAVISELSKDTKAALLDRMDGMYANRYKAEKKDRVVRALYSDMLRDYAWPSVDGGGMMSYSPKTGGDHIQNMIDEMRSKVESVTAEKLQAYADRNIAAENEAEELRAKYKEGLKEPKTIEDYQRLMRVKIDELGEGATFNDARMTLTLDQRIAFDNMVAEYNRDARKGQKTAQRTEVRVAAETTGAKIIEGMHTKFQTPLWIVQPEERVDGDSYKTLLSAAKRMGGNYVNTMQARRWKTDWGYQFPDMEKAEAFMKLMAGDKSDAQEVVKARRNEYEDDRSQSAVERLNEMADKLEDKAEELSNRDRKTNTSRRAGMAARAEAQAESQRAIAVTMRNIAAKIEAGDAKHLDQVRTKAQVEMLTGFLNTAKYDQNVAKYPTYSEQEKHKGEAPDVETVDYAHWPTYTAYRSDLARLGRQALEIEGMKKIGQRIMKVADDTSSAYLKFAKENLTEVSTFTTKSGALAAFSRKHSAEEAIRRNGLSGKAIAFPIKRGENLIIMSPSEAQKRGIWNGDNDKRITLAADLVETMIGKARRTHKMDVPWQFESAHEKRVRLSSMGIETPAEFRAMLREFVNLREAPKEADKIKEMERAMIGRRNDGLDFFPTPAGVADEMVETANIEEGMSVLEPSAGMGHIAERIREAGVEPDVIEMSGDRRELLEAKGFNVAGSDFLAVSGAGQGLTLSEASRKEMASIAKEVEKSNKKLAKLSAANSKRIETQGYSRGRATTYSANAGNEAEYRDKQKRVLADMVRSELKDGVAIPDDILEVAGSSVDYNESGKYDPIEAQGGGKYDRIIMNPPFSDRRDVQHVYHAYGLLKPGGRLVAIMGEGSFFGSDKKAQTFRDWLETVGGSEEKLPAGSFQDPSLPVNTGVNARMVVIDKGDVDAPLFSRKAAEAQPMFYSQLQSVLADKLPGSGSPGQLIATISAFQKKGLFKSEELEWSGLNEWLNGHAGKVTKDQVLDFLRANEVQIQEVEKGSVPQTGKENVIAEGLSLAQAEQELSRDEADAWYIVDNGDDTYNIVEDEDELGDVKFSPYQLPGGENYRELLLTLPTSQGAISDATLDRLDASMRRRGYAGIDAEERQKLRSAGNGTFDMLDEWEERLGLDVSQARAELSGAETPAGVFRSSHYDEPNILAHVRFNERTDADGKRVLFIEEVQSDWHQEGRKKGYGKRETADLNERIKDLDNKLVEIRPDALDALDEVSLLGFDSISEASRAILGTENWAETWDITDRQQLKVLGEWRELQVERNSLQNQREGVPDAVPNAPFKTTWPLLAMKRMIRYAAENGFDSIAWTTGEQQADRYDLAKQLDSIVAEKQLSGSQEGKYLITAYDLDQQQVMKKVLAEDELEANIGKDLAKKIIDDAPKNPKGKTYMGLDLTVGGEGMAAFYDKMLPSMVNKYVKKWGGKVGETEIGGKNKPVSYSEFKDGVNVYDEDGDVVAEVNSVEAAEYLISHPNRIDTVVHALPITDAMKGSVMSEGQPLFTRGQSENVGYTRLSNRSASVESTNAAPEDVAAVENLNAVLNRYFGSDNYGMVPHTGREAGFSRADQEAFRGVFGKRVVLVQPKPGGEDLFNGFNIPGGDAIFVNATSNVGFINVAGHELYHDIERTRPDLIEWYRARAKAYLKDFSAYRDRLNSLIQPGEPAYTDQTAESELLADFMGDSLADPDFLQTLADDSPSNFRKLMTSVRLWLSKTASKLRSLGSSKHVTDVEALQAYLGKVLKAYAAGKPVESVEGAPVFSRKDDSTDKPGFKKDYSALDAYMDGGKVPKGGKVKEAKPQKPVDADSTLFDLLRFKAQDKFHYLNREQKRVAANRGVADLPEAEDAYLAELRYHGMAGAAIEDFQRDHVDPLLEAISDSGVGMEDVNLYLRARHANEANAQLERINPDREDNQALSGMSNDEAAEILARLGGSAMRDIGNRVDAITKARRDILVDSGLETQDTVDKWESAYDHYVPLKRDGHDGRLPPKGRGFNTRGGEKRRAGSTSEVVHVLANVVAQYESTAIKAEKVKVGKAFLEFARNNPNRDLYEVDKVEYKPSFDAEGLVTYREDKGYIMADNVLVVRIDGIDHRVSFNEKSLEAMKIAHALNNLGADQSGAIVNVLSKFTRWLAIVNTGANPEFVISNFARDLQTAGYNLAATEIDDLKWTIIKDVGKAWRGIRAFQKGKNNEWAPHFGEFRKAGAQTGWLQNYNSIEDREKALVNKVRSASNDNTGIKVKNAMKAVIQFVEDENTAVENAIRLSAFVHAKRAGLSEAKAARIAKEMTVNFNRKGDMGQVLNAMYLFYNASIQGSVRLLQAVGSSRKVQAMAAATVVFAAILDIVNRAIGGDDDDGEARYDKIPDFVKERNLIIMLPSEEGDYIKVPLPWGYNTLHVMGQSAGEAMTKRDFDAAEAGIRVAGAVAGAFNPIGGSETIMQFLSPTITDPLVQWSENKDWAGRPIRPKGNPFGVDTPSSQKYWDSVRAPSKWLTDQLNTLTGGDEIRPGAIDISPEAIDLVIDTLTGGAGRFLTDIVATPAKAAKGDPVETYEVPLLRKLYGAPGRGTLVSDFYERMDAVQLTEKQIKHYRDDKEKVAEIRKDYPGESRLIMDMKVAQRRLSRIRKRLKQIEAMGDKDALESMRAIEEAEMRRYNKRYNEVMGTVD